MSHDEMITVIAAHRDGKPLQWKYLSASNSPTWFEWFDLGEPKPGGSFNFQHYLYRIKPEPPKPREVYVYFWNHVEPTGVFCPGDVRLTGIFNKPDEVARLALFREVLPDEEGRA